ncbi:MAG: hypothetical protein KGO51_13200 [Alphaproteobacteria bacterium]|nr:hypothetical protein [Alphaproteobacteria bacterium]
MRFAKWTFLAAGVYGFLVITPLFFLEGAIGRASGPITHPEYFYGWTTAALVFQTMFLAIGRDPVRFRPFMIVAMLEKFTWLVSLWTLAGLGRVPGSTVAVGSLDLVWGLLFVAAYVRTRGDPSSS